MESWICLDGGMCPIPRTESYFELGTGAWTEMAQGTLLYLGCKGERLGRQRERKRRIRGTEGRRKGEGKEEGGREAGKTSQ